MAELQSIHSENHVRLYARPTQRKVGGEKKDSGRAFIQLSCGGVGVDRDTYWNEHHTSNTARMVSEGVSAQLVLLLLTECVCVCVCARACAYGTIAFTLIYKV